MTVDLPFIKEGKGIEAAGQTEEGEERGRGRAKVTCPGVWLCPKGGAMLRVSMLGASAHTKRVEPTFPLLFHECFHFRKTFTGITSLPDLQIELTKRKVHIQLIQWQVHGCRCVLLASFCSPLSELLYPQPSARGHVAGVDVDLLMDSTACFPGIIAPKVEVSTKVVIEEMVNYPIHKSESAAVHHKTLSSKRTTYRRGVTDNKVDTTRVKTKTKATVNTGYRSRMRQKPVCHTRPRVKCNSCKQRVDWPGKRDRVPEGRVGQDDTLYLPYCNNCGDVVEETGIKHGKVVLKDPLHDIGTWEGACPCVDPQPPKSACDCSVCRKYNNYFKNLDISPPQSDFSHNLKAFNWRVEQQLSPHKKDNFCPCLSNKLGENVVRQRAGSCLNKPECPHLNYSTLADSIVLNGDEKSEEVHKQDAHHTDYKKLFQADIDSHYKRLYERVSRRSNRRES